MLKEKQLRAVSPLDSEVSALIEELNVYLTNLYPQESNHLDSPEILNASNCVMIGYYVSHKLVGIGAVKIMDGYGELKRFYVVETYRGNGIAECILIALEKWLIDNHIFIARLETGVHQLAAIRFYQKMGYRPCDNFGVYFDDPLSVFMEKDLLTSADH